MNLRIDYHKKPIRPGFFRPVNKDEYIPHNSIIYYVPYKTYYKLCVNLKTIYPEWTLKPIFKRSKKIEERFFTVSNSLQPESKLFLREDYLQFFITHAYLYLRENFLIKIKKG